VAEVNNPELEVWIDVSFIEKKPIKIGHLKHDRGNVRFNYNEAWLSHPKRFDIDPDLSLDNAIFHPNPAQGNFGVFLDSSPDRWGQTLMKRREAMEAKDEGRQTRTLYAWDYLIGVQDQTRQGALRFKYPGTDVFLTSQDLFAPPLTQLAELVGATKYIEGIMNCRPHSWSKYLQNELNLQTGNFFIGIN
jgi:serine/threonine-protein kinase HipA